MKVSKCIFGLSIAAMAMSFVACEKPYHQPEERYVLVVANKNLPYWQDAQAGLLDIGKTAGVKVAMEGPDTFSPSEELKTFEQVVAQKPSGILVSASDADVLRHRDLAELSETERIALAQLFGRLNARAPVRRSARRHPAYSGEIDPRRTMRAQLRQVGEPARVLHRPAKLGLSSALYEGIQASQGAWVAILDADNSHDVSCIRSMLQEGLDGADVVVGSRYVRGGRIEDWPLHRRVISMGATSLARMLFRLDVHDPMSGFALIRRETARRLPDVRNPRSYKLLLEIRNALDKSRLQLENVQLRRALKRFGLPNLVGKSDRMQRVYDLITQVAPSRATVLIVGESGTGKELAAKTIHATSPRSDRPVVPVNTGSMPVDLLESTLFGHVKGAFTSAIATKRGLFEVADQGTIFFDEIGTVGVETQSKLLRVIQEREFMRLGGTENIKVDVRILAATNVDLRRLVVENKFREDLYYRLNVIAIPLPPLRERKEDIPMLVDHFLKKFCPENNRELAHFSVEAMKKLMDYDWPGNVRELENAVERAVVLSSGPELGQDLLPEAFFHDGAPPARALPIEDLEGRSLFEIVEGYERRVILEMLERSRWSQTEAAEQFKIPLSTLNQKIKRLHIDVKRRNGG